MGSQIRCIFYAEFDNTLGPRVCFQAPAAFITPDDFASLSELLITRPDLCGKVMTVRHPGLSLPCQRGHGASAATTASASAPTPGEEAQPRSLTPATILGFPVGLHHERYQRNTLLFSVGFILEDDSDPAPFEPVLRKLGATLFSLEVEGGGGFLTRPDSRARLGGILAAILAGLNARGECFLPLDDTNLIALKLFIGGRGGASRAGAPGSAGAASSAGGTSGAPGSAVPLLSPASSLPLVRDHDVPVRLRDLDALGSGDAGWDLALAAVAPFIDGVAFVRAIAEAADVELGIVRRVIAQLAFYGCVALVDVFQTSNLYATQPKVQQLLHDPDVRAAALRFVQVDAGGSEGTAYPRPSLAYLFRLYAAFGTGSRVCDVAALADTAAAGVDERKLVVFGVIHGLLRRVHRYPTPVSPPRPRLPAIVPARFRVHLQGDDDAPPPPLPTHAALAAAVTPELARRVERLRLLTPAALALLDGTRHMEAVCCELACSQAALEAALEAHGGFALVAALEGDPPAGLVGGGGRP